MSAVWFLAQCSCLATVAFAARQRLRVADRLESSQSVADQSVFTTSADVALDTWLRSNSLVDGMLAKRRSSGGHTNISIDDIFSTDVPLPGRQFKDDIRDFFKDLIQNRVGVGGSPSADAQADAREGKVTTATLNDVLDKMDTSETCGYTAVTLLVEYVKWKGRRGGLREYAHLVPEPAYMTDLEMPPRVQRDPKDFEGTTLRHIAQQSPATALLPIMMQKNLIQMHKLMPGIAPLVDLLETALSTTDQVDRYGLLLINHQGHAYVIERYGAHCSIMQSSSRSFHLAHWLFDARPPYEFMAPPHDDHYEFLQKSRALYASDVPCEQLLDRYRAVVPRKGENRADKQRKMEDVALMGGESWEKCGMQPEGYADAWEQVGKIPFIVASVTPVPMPEAEPYTSAEEHELEADLEQTGEETEASLKEEVA